MYPPERRARGISYVLCGSVVGAVFGPFVFSPLFAGKGLEPSALVAPWLTAGLLMLIGLLVVVFVRPDPKRIAEMIGATTGPTGPAAPLRAILGRPGVPTALLAAVASFAVMVVVMNLTGYAVVHEHHHEQRDVYPIIGAHVFGMFALVLVVGRIVDRVGAIADARRGARARVGVVPRSHLGLERRRACAAALRPRARLESRVRLGHDDAREPRRAERARQARRVQRPSRRA